MNILRKLLGLPSKEEWREQTRQRVESEIGNSIGAPVMREILSTPDPSQPRRTEVTVMFTHLRGFWALNKKHSPELVVEILNDYFTRMHKIVFDHQGDVHRLEGDCMQLVFGGSLFNAQQDHAELALHCAVEMQEECIRFREACKSTGKPELFMRAGIATGEVIIGSVGSPNRANWMTVGYPVNLAARLEPLNEQFGSAILCSETTYQAAPDVVLADPIPNVQVKATAARPVNIYAIRGLKHTGPRDHLWNP